MEFCIACLISVLLAGYSTGQLYKSRDEFKVKIIDYCRTENCEKAQYSYHRNSCRGPNFWSRVTPCWGRCSSFRQSPVNIITDVTRYVPHGQLQFSRFCDRVDVQLIHRGFVPHFRVDRDSKIVMCNVPNQGKQNYIFRDVHPHIGRRETRGSEHAFDGSFYPIEIHLVFINSRYRTFREARTRSGGLAVIGVMVEIEENKKGRRSNRRGNTHQKNSCRNVASCRIKSATRLSHLMVKYFKKIDKEKTNSKNEMNKTFTADIGQAISLNDILPYDLSYYTYHGSLTTPPCYETVQWIMMRCPIKVTREAYKALANLPDLQGHPLSKYGTRRPLQRGITDHPTVDVQRNFLCKSSGNRRDVCYRRG